MFSKNFTHNSSNSSKSTALQILCQSVFSLPCRPFQLVTIFTSIPLFALHNSRFPQSFISANFTGFQHARLSQSPFTQKLICFLFTSLPIPIFDIVSLSGIANVQRDSLLAYSKITCIVAEFNKLETPRTLKKGVIMAIEDDLEQVIRIYASSPFLNKYRQPIETIKNQISQKRNEF